MAACLLALGVSSVQAASAPDAGVAVPTDTVQSPEALAGSTVEIAERYPTGSIDSVAAADAAIREIRQQRLLIEAHHAQQEQACMPTFFTNNCLDNAKERRRKALATLRPVEIEANSFKRHARAEERNRQVAAKTGKPQAESQPQVVPPTTFDTATASSETAPHKAHAVKPARKHVPKPITHNAEAQQRSMAAYDKKLADSAKRQKAVANRKAEAEQKRLKKQTAAQKAATPGASKPPAAADGPLTP